MQLVICKRASRVTPDIINIFSTLYYIVFVVDYSIILELCDRRVSVRPLKP